MILYKRKGFIYNLLCHTDSHLYKIHIPSMDVMFEDMTLGELSNFFTNEASELETAKSQAQALTALQENTAEQLANLSVALEEHTTQVAQFEKTARTSQPGLQQLRVRLAGLQNVASASRSLAGMLGEWSRMRCQAPLHNATLCAEFSAELRADQSRISKEIAAVDAEMAKESRHTQKLLALAAREREVVLELDCMVTRLRERYVVETASAAKAWEAVRLLEGPGAITCNFDDVYENLPLEDDSSSPDGFVSHPEEQEQEQERKPVLTGTEADICEWEAELSAAFDANNTDTLLQVMSAERVTAICEIVESLRKRRHLHAPEAFIRVVDVVRQVLEAQVRGGSISLVSACVHLLSKLLDVVEVNTTMWTRITGTFISKHGLVALANAMNAAVTGSISFQDPVALALFNKLVASNAAGKPFILPTRCDAAYILGLALAVLNFEAHLCLSNVTVYSSDAAAKSVAVLLNCLDRLGCQLSRNHGVLGMFSKLLFERASDLSLLDADVAYCLQTQGIDYAWTRQLKRTKH